MQEQINSPQQFSTLLLDKRLSWFDLRDMRFDTNLFRRRKLVDLFDSPGNALKTAADYSESSINSILDFERISTTLLQCSYVKAIRLLGSSVCGMAGEYPFDATVSTDGNKMFVSREERVKPPDSDIEILTYGDEEKIKADIGDTLGNIRDKGFFTQANSVSIGFICMPPIIQLFSDDAYVKGMLDTIQNEGSLKFLVEPYMRFIALHNYISGRTKDVYERLFDLGVAQLDRIPELDEILRSMLVEYFSLYAHKVEVKLGNQEQVVIEGTESPLMTKLSNDESDNQFGLFYKIEI